VWFFQLQIREYDLVLFRLGSAVVAVGQATVPDDPEGRVLALLYFL
jgi:hypothetical protein